MEGELDVLKDVSAKLISIGTPFMVTGSMAMNHYAEPRMTRDIDIVVALRRIDVGRLGQIFSDGYLFSMDTIFEAVERRSMFNMIHQNSVIKVDLIVQKDEEFRKKEFERRQKIKVIDFETYIVSKEDLILSKLDWAKDSRSELQFRDIKNLLSTSWDEKYLRPWAEKMGLTLLLEECLGE